MTWFRLPLFVWAHYATSLIQVLGTPVVAITIVMVVVERAFGFGIFDAGPRRRPGALPAPVLVLLAPGRLHHDPARRWASSARSSSTFSRKTIFGYSFVAFSSLAIAVFGFLVWAPPHVRGGHLDLRRDGVLVPELLGGHSVGGEDLQLDGDALQGLGQLRDADALRLRLHRAVHDRRPDRPVPGDAGRRHPRARHLLRGGALPLHHGGRRDHGLHGRPALLVAEDDGPDVLGVPVAHQPPSWSSSAST